jgi:hypothetical protein
VETLNKTGLTNISRGDGGGAGGMSNNTLPDANAQNRQRHDDVTRNCNNIMNYVAVCCYRYCTVVL